jgi:tetratricopeptide (TPR) repeat protein
MKATIFFILLVVFTGLNFAQDQYEIASSAIKKNDFQKALDISRSLLSHDSTDQAIKILVELTAHDSTDKGGYISLGDAYSKMSVYELALGNYKHAETLDSTDIQIKFKIAETLYKQKSYTDAANKYLQVIAIDSNNTQAYDKLGELLYYAKQYQNAAFYLTKYLKFDQKNSKVYYFAANSLFTINNFEDAVKIAEQGLQNFPQNNDLKRIESLSYAYLKKPEDAQRIADTTPDSLFSSRDNFVLGVGLLNAQKDSAAIVFLKKALDKDTSYVSKTSEIIARTYFSLQRYDSAVVYYSKKISVDPNNLSAYINKSICAYQVKNYDVARATLLEATQLKPDNIPTALWLARTYNAYKDSMDAATAAYKKVITLAQGSEDAHKDELAEAYGDFLGINDLIKKKYPSAIENLKLAVTFKPNEVRYHLWLAQAYALSGKKETAIPEYKKVLQLDPKNADAKKGLKLLTD